MAQIRLNVASKVVPMIYAYSTPEIERHNGWTKIGYTEQGVDNRLNQQTHTADVNYKEEWRGTAIYDDGSGDTFKDVDFHAYLTKLLIERMPKTEWFKVSGNDSRSKFFDFKAKRGITDTLDVVIPYTLRKEQENAVEQTYYYALDHENGEFLWNAKPRFGKTLAVYDLMKQLDAKMVLIVTNRPAIANSWYSDYSRFVGSGSGYRFVSEVDALKNKAGVLSREEYVKYIITDKNARCIEFVSLQDLKGSKYFGGKYDKLRELRDLTWDMLVIDEAHEGVDTYKTDIAFDQIDRKFTLHLSGTPFKALANDKFKDDAIYNWTYADEQTAKKNYVAPEGDISDNPYKNLPKLNLFTYQMSEIVKEDVAQGMEVDGEQIAFAFDLDEFFATKGGKFIHEQSVDRFLDALTSQEKFPFSTEELQNELKHTLWLLNRVDSAKALAEKLNAHPVFGKYKIVLCAGDGKLSEDEEREKSFDKVVEAIRTNEKTITLTVGQLTTGVTIPEWTAVMMLSNVKSPALYMQAAFRSQNPCLFYEGGTYYRKENAYVFDFDPARTLIIYEKFANDLSKDTSDGKGDIEKRKANIKELLNFFPVIGEDEDGEMTELDAEKVLSIPRKIKSVEVVKRGFMSDFLFQNISNIFKAPQEVIDMISQFTPTAEPKKPIGVDENTAATLNLDENGEVKVPDEVVVGIASDLFGEKVYDMSDAIINTVNSYTTEDTAGAKEVNVLEDLKEQFRKAAVNPIVNTVKEEYGSNIKPSDTKKMEKSLTDKADAMIERAYGTFAIEQSAATDDFKEAVKKATSNIEKEALKKEFDKKQKEALDRFKDKINGNVEDFVKEASKSVVEAVETKKREDVKSEVESRVRDHLRGFSRSIPSFLMAYGTDNTTLASFDRIIPDEVFFEVTGIKLKDFTFLRDGGDYTKEDGSIDHFAGNLFDPVVFDDSVKEFLRLKKKLANYFEQISKEDIFDYIPPQKTNQIFTPKKVVAKMVDMLEEENPNCFDDDEKTFVDLYMKSGLYITEIVKRLYNSAAIKEKHPDDTERLNHIFEKQVYGLAPTEIIYRIALAYILGFADEIEIKKHNLRQADALPYAKEGRLQELIDALYDET